MHHAPCPPVPSACHAQKYGCVQSAKSISVDHLAACYQQVFIFYLILQVPKGYRQSQQAWLHAQPSRQAGGLRAGRLQSVATEGTAVQVDADEVSENDRLVYERLAQEIAVRSRTRHQLIGLAY